MHDLSGTYRFSPTCRIALIAWAVVAGQSAHTFAQAEDHGQQGRMFAKPHLPGANPYKITELDDVELPVALSGFCAVTLRDQYQWLAGTPRFQLVFDGQIYWFLSRRELEIFAASPLEYAPALKGDCIVTFEETGKRVQGRLEHGAVRNGRIYLFQSEEHSSRFRADPSRFEDVDLAFAGNCIVSQVENRREVPGLPETTALVNGMRYQFLGDFQRRLFASNMERYGIKRQLLTPLQGAPVRIESASDNAGVSDPQATRESKSDSAEDSLQPRSAMDGFCPVTFESKGVWVRGSFQYQTEYKGKLYLMAGAKEKREFEDDPEGYVPALGGDCLVTKVDDGTDVPGSVYHATYDKQKEQKLYLFTGAEQLEKFLADPDKYREHLSSQSQEIPALDSPDSPSDEGEATDQ